MDSEPSVLARPVIRLLSEATVNRIAAGEVIERPAAAVKELVENAIDAGAKHIVVSLVAGGIDRIEVADDGSGMDAAGLALAVQRHATSKLADDQLVRIATLGFRGEALPSIGAAARLSIVSRTAAADHANAITVEGGHVSAVAPAAGGIGTRVVVRDLFFATPARRKFLKPARTEADHAEDAVRRLAFAAPGIAFRLESEGRIVFDLPRQDRATRIRALLGPLEAAALVAVDAERTTQAGSALRLGGWIAAPGITRATGAGQAMVVNGRPVTDPVLRTAIRVAYRDVIATGRFPVVALYIDLDPEELDVNVHPAKTELRFRDAGALRSLVIGGLRAALAGGAGSAMPSPAYPTAHRPPMHLMQSRSPPAGWRLPPLPGMAEHQMAIAGAPSARALQPAEPHPGPSARRRHRAGARHVYSGGRRRWRAGPGRPARRP